jgi:NADH-quinone oxidoreductase subunit I
MSIWGTGILKGMVITMRNMLRGPITVQYPREKLTLPERARWAVQLKTDEEGQHKCTACMACTKACPDFILDLEVETDEERNKTIKHYRYEMGACMMCGLCVEACPFDAIEMGQDYELARYDADELTVELITESPAAKPKRKAAPAKPAGSAPAAEKPAGDEPAAKKPPADDAPTAEKPAGDAEGGEQ